MSPKMPNVVRKDEKSVRGMAMLKVQVDRKLFLACDRQRTASIYPMVPQCGGSVCHVAHSRPNSNPHKNIAPRPRT